ncbi:Membrane transport protein [Aliarcobacter thereius]|uniref:AEC family transporter n=1 Tax=Aliarcobacter thereius TaxID=544718 RepID=A0A5R9GWR2_9BACT|nr:AEC family transporter [Aliarcobacter thereius]OCL86035.1 Membrane transport protein [Aliarcobacter thereius]OCL90518.1 Membrane transport protein [Aliarcobacter thereius]TLS71082.1 AEC family transporter [Aliarcobacter thereius]TLT06686.1 AEC family transporter [Aliarcobacter thereius]HJE02492.1 AEC family transporter [Aliarcobacter thereius]
MENILLILFALFLGYMLNRLNIMHKDGSIALNKFVLYVSYPAIVLLQTPKINFSFDLMIPVLIAWIVMTLSAVLILFLSKLFNFTKEVTGSLMLVAVLTNSSFLGIPLIETYMPDEDFMPYLLVYDQLGTFLAFAIYGTFIVSIYTSKTKITFKLITIKVITFPPFLCLIIALFFVGVEFHPTITKVLEAFAITTVPVALVAAGLQMQLKLPKDDIKPFSIALIIKLVFAPIVAIIICKIFGWEGLASDVSILEASMAPMITAGAIAAMAGLAPRLSYAIIGYGILISFGTSYIVSLIL